MPTQYNDSVSVINKSIEYIIILHIKPKKQNYFILVDLYLLHAGPCTVIFKCTVTLSIQHLKSLPHCYSSQKFILTKTLGNGSLKQNSEIYLTLQYGTFLFRPGYLTLLLAYKTFEPDVIFILT